MEAAGRARIAGIVNKREELESALAEAEAARARLETALARAEAALFSSVTDASKIDANRADTAAKVEKARARCRQLHAALVGPGDSEVMTRSRRRMRAPIKPLEGVSQPSLAPSLPSIPSIEQTVGGGNAIKQDELRQQEPIQRSDVRSSVQESPTGDVRANRQLLRQTIGLLALVLAYLAYFHVDIQLQIVNLPSIFP